MKHLKYLFKAKWTFRPPKKNKFVIVDNHNPFTNYLNKKDFTTLYRRGEEINFFVVLKCIINFNFSSLGYVIEFIKLVSPKLIFTAFDYHSIFFKISRSTNIKTIMVQKGKRSVNEDIILNSKKYFPPNSLDHFFVDYAFFHNESVTNFYSKRIKGNFFTTGSFENNFYTLNASNQKNEIVFISNFSQKSSDKCQNENILAYELSKLAAKNNLKFKILPRYRHNQKFLEIEKKFYKKISDDFKFISDLKKNSYEILLNYKYVFASYSTLAIEFLSKGGRAGFLMFKDKNNHVFDYRFGLFEKLSEEGLFWSSANSIKLEKIEKIFNYVVKTSSEKWSAETKNDIKKVLYFEKNNQTFLNILKDLNIS